MEPFQKRRARFKRGFTPPPLHTVSESSVASSSSKPAQGIEKAKPASHRLPLPNAATICERFVESTLRYFAKLKPDFWKESGLRFFYSRSEFLGKLRLGQHLEKYDQIIAACRKAQFPTLRTGKVEVTFKEEARLKRQETPTIVFRLTETTEWSDALAELRDLLDIQTRPTPLSEHAKKLLDWASEVPAGKTLQLSNRHFNSWSYVNCSNAVREAQAIDPRLFSERDEYYDWSISVAEKPLPWLALPSLDACFDFPPKLSKDGCDAVTKRIQEIVQEEYAGGRLTTDWLVLVRTASRLQALKAFGHLQRDTLIKITSKLKPIGMVMQWMFEGHGFPWMLAVGRDSGMTWSQVVEAIKEAENEIPSSKKYGLSKEAAALFDWLRRLPREDFEWNLSPKVTDEILETEVGIKNPWVEENAFLFFRLLTEEITRRTPFLAVAHPWQGHSSAKTRIEFRAQEPIQAA